MTDRTTRAEPALRGAARRAATRRRILDTASQLFYREGLQSVGVDRVAAEAGISKRTLYNHFPSKDDLVLAYLQTVDRPRSGEGPPLAQVLQTFDRIEANVAGHHFRGCPFVNAATEIADPDHPATVYARAFKRRGEEWLTARLREAGLHAPEALAAQIAVLIDGALVCAALHADPGVVRTARSAAETLLAAADKN